MRSYFVSFKANELEQIGKWFQEGKVKAIIDSKFAFEDVPEAFERIMTHRTVGKIVVDVAMDKC